MKSKPEILPENQLKSGESGETLCEGRRPEFRLYRGTPTWQVWAPRTTRHVLASHALNMSGYFDQSARSIESRCVVIGIDHDTVCAGVGGTAIRHSTSCAGRRAAAPAGTDRISGQFLFYHDHNFTKSKGNLRFQRHVPLFVPIGVCVTTHDDGTASDVTIGM